MSENKPTPFEIAQLAAMQNPKSADPEKMEAAVRHALHLWMFAATEIDRVYTPNPEAKEQLRILLDGIFSIPADEWRERIKDFKGSEYELSNAISSYKLPLKKVREKLFPDRSLTNPQREKLFLGLAAFARRHNIPYGGKTGEDGKTVEINSDDAVGIVQIFLKMDPLSGHDCRWAYEVRQAQISHAKKR